MRRIIDIYTIYCYYIGEEVIKIKAKVGFKVNGKWSYLLARGDLEALINEFDDLMRKDEVTQITIKFYEESKKNV